MRRSGGRVSRTEFLRGGAAVAFSVVALPEIAAAQNNYPLTPDSERHPDVPMGTVTSFKVTSNTIFPGTVRDGWVYVPKQYDAKKPACVMIFQDGGGFQDNGGGFRVPIIFDNLIARGEMPVTIGIFLNPGTVPAMNGNALPRYNRSFEYDSPTDLYARFLIEEVLPEVGKNYNLSQNPDDRGLCGSSSGGIASFAAAWFRPDAFRRVISFIGSFTDLRGGHSFDPWIRKMEPEPLRVFQQDGERDQNIYSGHWFIGNQGVSAALDWAKYDHKWVTGTGSHDGVQARAILPDALKWLWRDWPAPLTVPETTPQPVMTQTLLPKENWKKLAMPAGGTAMIASALATSADGVVYAAAGGQLVRLDTSQIVPGVRFETAPTALAFAPDGRLWAALPAAKKLLAVDIKTGKTATVVQKVAVTGLAVSSSNHVYAAEGGDSGRIWRIAPGGKPQIAVDGLDRPVSLALTPDQTQLLVATETGGYVRSYMIAADGSLVNAQDYHEIYAPPGTNRPHPGGMIADTNGWLYLCSAVGIQMLDQAGRVNGIVANPDRTPSRAVAFGGASLDTLYAINSDGAVFARKTRAKGVVSCQPPIKPPGPRL